KRPPESAVERALGARGAQERDGGESYECSSTRVVLDRLQLPRELDRVARAVAIAGGVEQATDRRPVCRVAAACNGGGGLVAAGRRVVEIEAAVQLEVDHGDVMR